MEKRLRKIISKAIKKQNKIKFKCFKEECSNPAINSHSQSLSNALRKISQRGHLTSPKIKLLRFDDRGIDSCFKKIGIRRASIFKGFCNKHDNEYFKTVDNIKQDNITKEALTRLAFRTFAYEERTKEKSIYLLDYIIANAKEICDISYMQAHARGIRNHLTVTRPYYTNKFITMFESQNYEQIQGVIFILNKMLPLSCSTAIDPTMIDSENLMEGDLKEPLNLTFFNVIPQTSSTLVIFTCFEKQKEILQKFIDKLIRLENIIFNHCEEILMDPSFCDSLESDLKYKIVNGLRAWVAWEKEDFPNLFNVRLESPLYI